MFLVGGLPLGIDDSRDWKINVGLMYTDEAILSIEIPINSLHTEQLVTFGTLVVIFGYGFKTKNFRGDITEA